MDHHRRLASKLTDLYPSDIVPIVAIALTPTHATQGTPCHRTTMGHQHTAPPTNLHRSNIGVIVRQARSSRCHISHPPVEDNPHHQILLYGRLSQRTT